MSKLSWFSLLAVTTLSLGACRDRDSDAAELTADASNASQAEASLLAATVDGAAASTVAPATAETAAAFIAARAPARYSPSGCVTVTQTGLTVTLGFAQCTGPRGLRELDGTMSIVVSSGTGGAIVFDASAVDFQIGSATLDIDATATYTVNGGTSTLAVSTATTGIGPLGYEIAHTGDYTATWDASCVSIDGAWATERGEASRSTTASVMRCLDQCPRGTITRTTVARRVIELSFDGTSTARWSASDGRSGSFGLACEL